MKFIFTILFLGATVSYSYGSNHQIDSLKKLLQTLPENDYEKRIRVLNDIAWKQRTNSPEESKIYSEEAYDLAVHAKLLQLATESLNIIGIYHKNKRAYIEALEKYNQSLKMRIKLKDTLGISGCYVNIGVVYRRKGEPQNAIKAYNDGLKILKKIKNSDDIVKEKIARIYSSLGNIYRGMDDFEESLQYLQNALEIRILLKDKKEIADAHLNIGIIYEELFNFLKAFEHHSLSLQNYKELKDSIGIAKVYNNIGTTFFRDSKYDSAFKYYSKSLEVGNKLNAEVSVNSPNNNMGLFYEQRGKFSEALTYYEEYLLDQQKLNNIAGIARAENHIGSVLGKQGRHEEALKHYETSLSLAKKVDDLSLILDCHRGISEIYAYLSKFDTAFIYSLRYDSLKEIIHTSFVEAKQFETKLLEEQKKNEVQEARNERQLILIIGLIIVIILLIAVGTSLRRAYLQKRKTADAEKQILLEKYQKRKAQQKIKDLLKEQELKSIHKMLEVQEKERQRIAKDLHDRLGSMLSTVKLYFKTVDDKLNVLHQENQEQYYKANELLDEACAEVRKIAHNMVSGVLVKFGLIPALEDLTQTINKSAQFKVKFFSHGLNARFEQATEINIYRIIQELISNVMRHAEATELSLQLTKDEGNLNIMMEDDGVGFDAKSENFKSGIGLKNVNARVKELEGDINIDSGKGNGTTININIPIK